MTSRAAGIFTNSKVEVWVVIFLDSLFSDIDSLILYAGIHRKIFGFHRLLSKRFPHAIYYQVETENEVVVYRVLDCRQNPHKIQATLRKTHD